MGVDLRFTQEQLTFRDEVRSWLADHTPREKRPTDGAAARAFDSAWQLTQYEGGWAGLAWPEEAGGRGLSLIHQLIWHEEYGRAGAPPPGFMFIALNHGGPTLIAKGNAAQKAFHLPRILRGESVWCQGFSEPGSGSDLASLKTRAVIEGDELVVTGQKIWTSYAAHADYQELLVRTDASGAKQAGITWVICDMRSPGITVRPIRTINNDYHFNEVFYDAVRIPIANVVGEVNDGWAVAQATLAFERGTAMIPHQMALSRELDELTALAKAIPGPSGSGTAWERDDIRTRIATARAEVYALKAMTYGAISRGQRDNVPGAEGAIVALYHGELAQRVQRLALDIIDDDLLDRDSARGEWIGRYLDAFKYTIGGGTSQVRRNIIAERVLGLPREKALN